jgi:hypothetical protein
MKKYDIVYLNKISKGYRFGDIIANDTHAKYSQKAVTIKKVISPTIFQIYGTNEKFHFYMIRYSDEEFQSNYYKILSEINRIRVDLISFLGRFLCRPSRKWMKKVLKRIDNIVAL